ncbi:MAG TPA: ATP-binding protein [Anaerolineae bacterium]
MFVDREAELSSLDSAWHSDRAEFIVVYGRRRVGKTALLRAFCENRPGIFWVATLGSEAILRRSFTDTVWQGDHPGAGAAGFTYESWERAFVALGELAGDRRLVVVIDEFPYLANADAAVSSVLQKVWDEHLQNTRLMLILCGSHVGMMERELLEYRAPLYGRRTGQINLRPLPLAALPALFPTHTAAQQIETYAVLGGIPAYLTRWDGRQSLLTNIEQRILSPASYLYLEPQFLLREELQEPRNYFALLQAIAQGKTRLGEIVQATGMERGPASRYLAILQDLHLVERRVPVTERQPDKSRRGVYRLRDPFLAFWFRFVAPYVSTLELGHPAPVVRLVDAQLSQFVGPVFEDLCREWVTGQAAGGRLPLVPQRIGAWWDNEEEIDLVAPGERALLAGECKWSTRPVGTNVLDDLKRKAHTLALRENRTLGPNPEIHYALFARSGFTDALHTVANAEGVLLVGPDDLVAAPTAG